MTKSMLNQILFVHELIRSQQIMYRVFNHRPVKSNANFQVEMIETL